MRSITGLPATLGDAARAYIDGFPPGDIVGFPITSLDRTGVPVWIVALFLDDAPGLEGAMPSGIGYGATDEEAILGSLGEIAEAIAPTLALRGAKIRASYDALVRVHGASSIADPLTLGLPAGSPVDRATPLDWVEGTRAADGSTVLIPIDIAACDIFELSPGYRPFTTLITNGLGAGPDLDWAIGHGLLEVLQRDGNGLNFRALDRGVALTEVSSPLLDRFASLGIRAIPKFATDDFGLTNLYVVGHDEDGADCKGWGPPAPISLSACGEACHPDAAAALTKALSEFAAARVRKAFSHGPHALVEAVAPPGYTARFIDAARAWLVDSESRALNEMLAWARLDTDALLGILQPVYATRATKAFAELPSTPAPDAHARGRIARARVAAEGFDILYVDCSPAGRSTAAVKVIVPGLEVETMSYHRLGARNARRLIERGDSASKYGPLIKFGTPTDTLRPVRMPPEQAEALGSPLFDTALADAIVGPLYPLYREPEAHHVSWMMEQEGGRAA